MAGLKKYDYTTENGYTTTLLLTADDAKVRGLVSQDDAAKAKRAAAAKAAAEAKAQAEADAKAAEAQKQAPAPQNKQAGATTK